jgi:hypothetical protein
MSSQDWSAWLQEWNRILLDGLEPGQPGEGTPDLTPEIVASGWLGAPGAGEAELTALEARLGTTLPPSYRSFLKASNGFLQPNVLVPRLLSSREVDWYRTRHQDTIDAWFLGAGGGGGPPDYPGSFEQYLPTALQVSAVEHAGTAVYLLNPQVVSADGEWEALYFAHWVPGVNRYPSFRALMEAERTNWTPPGAPPPPRPSQWTTWWSTVRWIFRPE